MAKKKNLLELMLSHDAYEKAIVKNQLECESNLNQMLKKINLGAREEKKIINHLHIMQTQNQEAREEFIQTITAWASENKSFLQVEKDQSILKEREVQFNALQTYYLDLIFKKIPLIDRAKFLKQCEQYKNISSHVLSKRLRDLYEKIKRSNFSF